MQSKLQRPLGEPELFIFFRFFTDSNMFAVDLKFLGLIIKTEELASNLKDEGIYLNYQSMWALEMRSRCGYGGA